MLDYRYHDKNYPNSMFLKKFSADPKDYVYSADVFRPHFEKVKFIVREFYRTWKISRPAYKKLYSTDILDDFPYATYALRIMGMIQVTDDVIKFAELDETELYPYMLFFVGRQDVKRVLNH
jgi:hypothetical protein